MKNRKSAISMNIKEKLAKIAEERKKIENEVRKETNLEQIDDRIWWRIFEIAWDLGHSAGKSEILFYVDELKTIYDAAEEVFNEKLKNNIDDIKDLEQFEGTAELPDGRLIVSDVSEYNKALKDVIKILEK